MTDIAQQVDFLIELQKLDKKIYEFQSAITAKPKELENEKAGIDEQMLHVQHAEDQLKQLQLLHKEKEMELSSKEENVKKLQSQLFQVKTNKEYSALQNEIEGLKADNSLLEEEIIVLLDKISEAEELLHKEKERSNEKKKKFGETETRFKTEIEHMEQQLLQLQANRQKITPQVDKKILDRYERILEGRNGFALAPVINGSCGGCNMDLPPQMVNEVQLKNNIVTCERCARILFWQEKA
ncbi:MAG: hypothetical protein JW844_01625 [Candidatus Omnitrophica bacterium]|nr:hypothetical protein [Candidatus Omnitrophota bacterium]